MTEDRTDAWVAVSKECFEYNLVPWMGRPYEPWLRASTQPHPVDPVGRLLIPGKVYDDVFKSERIPLLRANKRQVAAMGARKLREQARGVCPPEARPNDCQAGYAAAARSAPEDPAEYLGRACRPN
jgi:hypothetical protein